MYIYIYVRILTHIRIYTYINTHAHSNSHAHTHTVHLTFDGTVDGGGKGDGTGQKAGSGKETKPAPVERPKQEERPTTCSADFCKNGCVYVYAHCCTIVCTLPAISVSQTTSMNARIFPGLSLTNTHHAPSPAHTQSTQCPVLNE